MLAGIDEAGLGPILGPLVVAGTALAGPRGADAWRSLEPVVAQAPRRRHPKGERHPLLVADSKRVKQGPDGLARLERTALTFWTAYRGELPETLGDWLEDMGSPPAELGERRPWYSEDMLRLELPWSWQATPRDSCPSRASIELDAHLLERALDTAEIELAQLAVKPLDVTEFNASIAETDNKSRTHFAAYAEVLGSLIDKSPLDTHIIADRCGGIVHYRNAMTRSWPDRRVRCIREEADASSYRVGQPGNARLSDGSILLTFATAAEDAAFPTALASCLAKYVRESMMHCLNRWFGSRDPDVRPTAGYTTDGRRFLEDVRPIIEREGIDRKALVRSR